MKKKYLFYDNILRGGGVGHTLFTYNKGLKKAINSEQIFLPSTMILGHGCGDNGFAEAALGLPLSPPLRSIIRDSFPHEIEHVSYTPSTSSEVEEDFSLTRDYFLSHYKNRKIVSDNHLYSSPINITMTIRRGDIACGKQIYGNVHPMTDRLLPDSYFQEVLEYVLEAHQIKDFYLTIYSDADMKELWLEKGKPFDGDWKENYVNEKCEPIDIYKLFNKYKGRVNYFPSQASAPNTLAQVQNCIASDICIASISGFSELISLYKTTGLIIFPSTHRRSLAPKENTIYYDC